MLLPLFICRHDSISLSAYRALYRELLLYLAFNLLPIYTYRKIISVFTI